MSMLGNQSKHNSCSQNWNAEFKSTRIFLIDESKHYFIRGINTELTKINFSFNAFYQERKQAIIDITI